MEILISCLYINSPPMNPALTHIHDTLIQIKTDIQKEIIGQDTLIEKLIITFFAGGHALLEWVPGLGKTRTIRVFAGVLGLDTGRISFTPDLLPSDLTGNEIYRAKEGKFEIRKWPIFTGILLADEINRTPPKVQSALLEAMEEKRVTIGNTTLDLPTPFVVFATQNPLEHEGTYPLPEAQLDRFLMRIVLSYPHAMDEKRIFLVECSNTGDMSKSEAPEKRKTEDLIEMMDYITKSVRVDEKIYDYVSDIVSATRQLALPISSTPGKDINNGLTFGDVYTPTLSHWASTRAGLALIRAGRVRAVIAGRDYMLPEDVASLAHDVLDHRVGLSYESMSEWVTAYSVIEQILDSVRIP